MASHSECQRKLPQCSCYATASRSHSDLSCLVAVIEYFYHYHIDFMTTQSASETFRYHRLVFLYVEYEACLSADNCHV